LGGFFSPPGKNTPKIFIFGGGPTPGSRGILPSVFIPFPQGRRVLVRILFSGNPELPPFGWGGGGAGARKKGFLAGPLGGPEKKCRGGGAWGAFDDIHRIRSLLWRTKGGKVRTAHCFFPKVPGANFFFRGSFSHGGGGGVGVLWRGGTSKNHGGGGGGVECLTGGRHFHSWNFSFARFRKKKGGLF